jgi:hypothetical protein
MSFPTNGGWVFRQPQFGNWTNPMALVGKDASVKEIIKARKANAALSAKHNLSTDYAVVEKELEEFQQARGALPQTAPTFFQSGHSRLPARVVAVATDIKRAAQGTGVVLDWLTSGGAPVAQDLAEKRAAVCVACPKNVEGAWYTVAPAQLIKATLEARKDIKLETRSDGLLKSCDVCKCLMRLKVHVPLDYITKNTKPDIMGEFPDWCWIKKECESASVTSASPKVP